MPKVKDPERVATGRIGAYKLHGMYDSKALTKAAGAGWLAKFRREAREAAAARGEQLSEAELERRAISLRRSYMARMAWERESRKNKKAASLPQPAASPAPIGVPSSSAPMRPNGITHDSAASSA